MHRNDATHPSSVEPLLDPRAAADLLGVAVGTLAEWRCFGTGPAFIKMGRHVRYAPAALRTWVAAQTRTSTTDPGPEAA